jgi:glycosyltransferase involved in cell wall biosynthesis
MLTVLMATYNGARTLPDVLTAYCHLESPEEGWKLVIIDNGSTDQTKEIISSFSQRLPLTYRHESRRGKSVALNTGLSSVSGDLVVFTDDDVLPQPNWLRQICSTADSQLSFSIFGGPILPKWEFPPEDWILEWVPLSPMFAILYPAKEGPIDPRLVFGPNMTIRADVFHNGNRFDETLGPKGSHYAMGEETEFNVRLAKAGFKAWHCQEAVVYHMIRAFQMTQDWVLDRAIHYGRARYRQELRNSVNAPVSSLGIPWSLLSQIWAQSVQSLRVSRAKWSGNAEKIFKARWQLNFLTGRALEARLRHNVQSR